MDMALVSAGVSENLAVDNQEEVEIAGLNSQNSSWENESLAKIPFKVLRGHSDGVNSCKFCIDGTHVLSGSDDGTAKLWGCRGTKLISNYAGHMGPVSTVKVSKDSTKCLTCSWDKTLHFWDLETAKILWTGKHDGIVMSGDISLDGKYVVSCSDFDNTVKLWSAENGTLVHELKEYHRSTPTCCLFSPNAERIVTTSMDRSTKIWDTVSKNVTATLTDHYNIISACCFSANERYLCTASWDKTLRVFDISTGMYRSQGSKLLNRGHEGCVSCCQFSVDSQTLVSGGYDKAVILWDIGVFAKKLTMKGHVGWVTDVDISPDNKWILSASKDKTIRMWNMENCNQIPAVLESRRAMGLKIAQCENCGKPFSIAQVDDIADFNTCVFCRLADPARNALPSIL